jgi:D-glycero-D-manno-heptose 1,7-bisphosphate phosphatase
VKLIILDRDGVINHDSEEYIKSPTEWVPVAGSLEAIARLNHAGYKVVVVTNQSGIGTGVLDVGSLNRIHEKMHRQLAELGGVIEAVFFCPHAPSDGCSCRKPRAGLFDSVARRFRTNLNGVTAVGDSLRDIQAARTAGCRPVLVLTGKGKRTLAKGEGLEDVAVFVDLAAVVDEFLLEEH